MSGWQRQELASLWDRVTVHFSLGSPSSMGARQLEARSWASGKGEKVGLREQC